MPVIAVSLIDTTKDNLKTHVCKSTDQKKLFEPQRFPKQEAKKFTSIGNKISGQLCSFVFELTFSFSSSCQLACLNAFLHRLLKLKTAIIVYGSFITVVLLSRCVPQKEAVF